MLIVLICCPCLGIVHILFAYISRITPVRIIISNVSHITCIRLYLIGANSLTNASLFNKQNVQTPA